MDFWDPEKSWMIVRNISRAKKVVSAALFRKGIWKMLNSCCKVNLRAGQSQFTKVLLFGLPNPSREI